MRYGWIMFRPSISLFSLRSLPYFSTARSPPSADHRAAFRKGPAGPYHRSGGFGCQGAEKRAQKDRYTREERNGQTADAVLFLLPEYRSDIDNFFSWKCRILHSAEKVNSFFIFIQKNRRLRKYRDPDAGITGCVSA